ncbi:MAG: 1-deoxy-D-xylulose-5-phosphate reductoisomerase [Bacteroidales bacterium]|jgi:1-deoxy-D-xylulose-5-phosphate reductoisomerase|nr:1-deoxy-D-xylulose-5-phosphate reductoisomerase [Bacteroidales bacterium]
MGKKRIALLGSTGSIGTQTLDVISRHRNDYEIELLTANQNSGKLIEQAIMFRPNNVVICNEKYYDEVFEALNKYDIKVFAGKKSAGDLAAASDVDIVVSAITGFNGLEPTVSAIKAGKTIALANKETLVAAGSIITKMSRKYSSPIIPVDSEHSAIFQCLAGEMSSIEKILLTASGGAFLKKSAEEMKNAGIEEALSNPNWNMGAKVTIDSADMMNKGLEMIEASWLFGIPPEKIEILIQPQSIIHSMVQFEDGSIKAQLGFPDMRIPIQYALTFPLRKRLNTKRLDFAALGHIDFIKPDKEKYPALDIAYYAHKKGGNADCIMNAANETAVSAFLAGRIKFGDIIRIVERTLEITDFIENPSLDDIFATNEEAVRKAGMLLQEN